MGDPQYIVGTSYFPVIHILGAQLSHVTGIELFNIVKWFPSLLDVALVLVLYLLIRNQTFSSIAAFYTKKKRPTKP